MKTCEQYAALLDPFIDGLCTPEEAEAVRGHLAECEVCRAYVADIQAIRAAFPTAEDTPVPEGFAAGVMAAIRTGAAPMADAAPKTEEETVPMADAASKDSPARWRWAKRLLPLAACCAILVVAVSLLPTGGVSGAVPSDSEAGGAPATEAAGAAADAPAADGGADEDAAPSLKTAAAPASEPPETAADTGGASAQEDAPQSNPAMSGPDAPAAQAPAEPRSFSLQSGAAPAAGTQSPAGSVYARSILLTAEQAGTLLAEFTPAQTTDSAALYELNAEAFDALLAELENGPEEIGPEQIAEAVSPTTELCQVIVEN